MMHSTMLTEIRPVISIGMPVYNCERTVLQAIRSIQKQTFASWELIIIDDGSTDRTGELVTGVTDPRIRFIPDHVNKQLPYRLNQCVQLARGEYFARMDGDDVSFPHRLEQQLAYLKMHPEIDLLGGAIVVFHGNGMISSVPPAVVDHDTICGPLWARFRLTHPTWFARTDWFRRHPYDNDLSCTQDRALLLQTHREARFGAIPEIVLAYRQESVPLRKSLPMRLQYVKALWRDGRQQREICKATAAMALEAAKSGVDVVSACLGKNHRFAGGAPKSVDPEITSSWATLWSELNAA